MKDLMALIQYRLKEADESIKEAEVLLREGMSRRAVMNRMYYAMFYAEQKGDRLLFAIQAQMIQSNNHNPCHEP
jgi:uncharacterized protein (UPF0332 family)